MAGLPASIAQIVRAGLNADRDELHTAMPAEVVVYDPLTETAFVRPVLKHALYTREGERVFEDYPEIPFVPLVFPSGGGMTIRLPVEAGDTVLLVFSESSMAEWRSSGQASAQEDARRHSLGWPVAIPGLFPDTKIRPPLDAAECAAGGMVIGDENGTAKVYFGGTMPGIRFGQVAVSPIALGIPTDAAVSTVMTALAAIIAKLNSLITKYNAHTHAGVTTGTGASGTTANTESAAGAAPAAPSTTQSILVKSL